ncbi:uncharacterized protein JNUCC1_03655 [Lentibacillus sp. JNUCC-1]|nr:uncharacterized protein [Lentibacillus sp. JNUCC-1]
MVQTAVDQFREQTDGLLPIRTKPNETPIFQKYLIDFAQLKERNLLTEIPGNAFENGGVYTYAIIYPETDPQVKLIDLRLSEEIRRINLKLDMYRDEHLYPPYGSQIADGVFQINYKKLGLEEPPHVVSPFSNVNLPIVMDTTGSLYIDYRIDLNKALEEQEHNYQEKDDIRYILAETSPFLPAYSLPYTVENGEPVFMAEK